MIINTRVIKETLFVEKVMYITQSFPDCITPDRYSPK